MPTVEIQQIDFDYMQGKARLQIRDSNKEREVKATIRIRKDSVIWMNFTVVGVQGGKALINKDSITILSNVDKEYFVFEYKELSKRYNFHIDYSVIQAAILGNLLQTRNPLNEIQQFEGYNLLVQKQGVVTIKNFINAASTKIEKIELTESDNANSLLINYRNFQPVGDKIFPYFEEINLNYKSQTGLLNNIITIEFNKVEVGGKELNFPFNIPRKYDRR
ncbi:MAG: DUF4292 domain-containing protein [Flammeovirgaceae bacterium]|nr:DUF4292 domain-containing protein [Flammeovirgaceae bacterium]